MNNYLFFRTDRIGDFLVSAILIKSIKRNDKNSFIKLVASKKNYFFIKSLDFVDEVYLYPDNFLKKIFFFFKLFKTNYHLICALDGKKRSIYFSIMLNSKKKFLMTTKKFFKRILHIFFTKIFYFNESKDKLFEIKNVLSLCKMSLKKDDLFFLKDHKIIPKKIQQIENYLIFHFDEKWIDGEYIDKYSSIQPNLNDINTFIKNLINKTNLNVVITTGVLKNNFLEEYLLNFNKINDYFFEKNYGNKKVQIYLNIDIFDLKFLIKNSSFIITCHGAPTHIASAMDKKIYDIFDKSQEEFYYKWTNHIENYSYFFRENFKELTNKILLKI